MPRRAVETSFIHMNGANLSSIVKPNTRVVYFETPINPTMELIDIENVCKQVAAINANRTEDKKIFVRRTDIEGNVSFVLN